MKIRKATKKDIPRILELFNSDSNLVGDDKLKYSKSTIENYIKPPVNKTFVCEIDGKTIGVVQTQFWEISKYIYLNDIIVDKDYQKKGVGFELQSFVERLARKEGYVLIYLFSEANNTNAHKLFEKGNFKRGKKFVFFSKILG